MHEVSCRVREGYIGSAGYRPFVGALSRADIDFHQCCIVACSVEAAALMIDIEPVRAIDGKLPVVYLIQFGQRSDENHRGLADGKKDPGGGGGGYAPSRPAGGREGKEVGRGHPRTS